MAVMERAPSPVRARSTCILCEGLPGEPWFEIRGHRLLQCPSCGMGWTALASPAGHRQAGSGRPHVFGGGGGRSDDAAAEPALRRNARDLLDVLEARHPDRGTLLEVGCAAGLLLDEARRRGWRTRGIEPSPEVVETARARFGLDVRAADYSRALLPVASFDAICFVQSLEHASDPFEWLERAAIQLRPGGTVLIETWDAMSDTAVLAGRRWQQLSPPFVQFWFTRWSLRRMLERAGFEDVSIGSPGKDLSLDWILSLLGGTYLGRLARVARRLVRLCGLGGVRLSYRLDDLVRVVARKR